MLQFKIQKPSKKILNNLQFRVAHENKPGSGGFLFEFAQRLALIQQNTKPTLQDPHLFLFAGDHNTGLSLKPEVHSPAAKEVNALLTVRSITSDIAKNESLKLKIVDACVRFPLESTVDFWLYRGDKILPKSMRLGTKEFLFEPAMTSSEAHKAISIGASIAEESFYKGVNFLVIGQIGASVEASCYALACRILQKRPSQLLYAYDPYHEELIKILQRTLNRHPESHDPFTQLSFFGGYDMAMILGMMLKAAEKQMMFLIDDFPSLLMLNLAQSFHPEVLDYAWIGQGYKNKAQELLLEKLGIKAKLQYHLPHYGQMGLLLSYSQLKYATELFK